MKINYAYSVSGDGVYEFIKQSPVKDFQFWEFKALRKEMWQSKWETENNSHMRTRQWVIRNHLELLI